MKKYTTEQIRNISLVGHSGSGKTTLVEALLHHLGEINEPATVEKGGTVSDYDPEEIKRQHSLQASLIPFEYKNIKVNILDCPGSRDFVGEVKNAIRASELAMVVIDAATGVEVGTEFAVEFADEYRIPKAFFVNKMDGERADFAKALESIEAAFDGVHTIPVELPIGKGADFKGVIDLLFMRAVIHDSGKAVVGDIPAEYLDEAKAARRALVEAAAEGNDDLTEKFLMEEELTNEEVILGLRQDLEAGRFCPVLCGSAGLGYGMRSLLNFIQSECPPPNERKGFLGYTDEGKEGTELKRIDPGTSFSGFVFKTVNDEFLGRVSYFKIITGEIKGDCTIKNMNGGQTMRVGHVFAQRGKTQVPLEAAAAGDIAAFAKLDGVKTGDTLCDPKASWMVYEPTHMPPPTVHYAITAKSKSDEDKLGMALHKMLEADPTLSLERDSLLRQTVISGMGDAHLELVRSRLLNQSKIEINLDPPRVQYRETLGKAGEGQGKFKKQSGGRGQYGDCWVRFKPLARGEGFKFEWKIVGGAIPTNFTSSVEKGIHDAMERGIIAGYPVVDIAAECYDGSYHAVDSSDMAFQVAASLAFKNVTPKCSPQLLEPINMVTIRVPDEYMGDVMGYVSGKRGRISGSDQDGNRVVVRAEVPAAEMASFSQDLRSMTQGRSVFESTFHHYDPVPQNILDKVIAEVRIDHHEEH